MNGGTRVGAILSLHNFNKAFRWFFSSCNNQLWKRASEDGVITQRELAGIVFSDNYSRYSEAECDLLAASAFNLKDLPHELSHIASECLELNGDNVGVCKSNYKVWKSIALENGQDLFACALPHVPKLFDWPFSLQILSNGVDLSLSDGYAENHCHFFAAGPSFILNWISLHNGRPYESPISVLESCSEEFIKYYSLGEYNRFINISWLSVYLRRRLYHQIKGTDCSSFPDAHVFEPSGTPFEDCASSWPRFVDSMRKGIDSLPVSKPSSQDPLLFDYAAKGYSHNPLYGERVLLWNCLREYEKWGFHQQSCFYLYLLCRKYIYGFFCQSNYWYGFRNFKRFERLGEVFIPLNPAIKKEVSSAIHLCLRESSGVRKLEIRVAPKRDYASTVSRIRMIKPNLVDSKIPASKKEKLAVPKYGLVLHFIKESEKRMEVPCNTQLSLCNPRLFNKIAEYEKQTADIRQYALGKQIPDFPLVGIDAANEEIRCRPEVFAPFYRTLRRCVGRDYHGRERTLNLRFTFHAGEDFVTLANGLRAIYEAFLFLGLSDGDRIGHGSALGTDASRYFQLKGRTVFETKQDLLDDYCFLYRMVVSDGERADLIPWLSDKIKDLLINLYGTDNIISYLHSIELRADYPYVHQHVNNPGDYVKVLLDYKSRGEEHYIDVHGNTDYLAAWLDSLALKLIHDYHFSSRIRFEGDKVVSVRVDNRYYDAICIAQRRVAQLLIDKRVSIETNPTSNYLIGPFEEFEDIPALSFSGVMPGKEYFKDLYISIGTDDPCIFGTNLRNEYASLFVAIEESGLLKGKSLVEKMRSIAKMSMDISFIK